MLRLSPIRSLIRLAVGAATIAGAAVVAVPAADVAARLDPGDVTILEEAGYNSPLFSIAYNPDKDEYLAVWLRNSATPNSEIAGVVLDANGEPKGTPIELAVGNSQVGEFPSPTYWSPDVEYNPVSKEFLLIYLRTGIGAPIIGRRISDSGQPVGTEAPLNDRTGLDGSCVNVHPDVVADPATGGYVLVFERVQASTTPGLACEGLAPLEGVVIVQTLSGGMAIGASSEVPQGIPGFNVPFIARNPVTGTFLVTHSAPDSGPGGVDPEYGHIYTSSLQPVGGTITLVDQAENPGEDSGSYVKAVADPVSGNWIALVNNSRFGLTQMNVVSSTGQMLSNASVVREGSVGSLSAVGDGTVLLSTSGAGNVQHLRQDGTEIHATSPLANGNVFFSALSTNGDPVASKAVFVGLNPVGATKVASAAIDIFDPGPLSLSPARLLDTRDGADISTIDGLFTGGGKKPAGAVVELKVRGRGGVPADADAVMLNVAAAGATASGFVTAYPCDAAERPTTSNLNYAQGGAASAAAIAKVSADGTVCLFTSAGSHLIVDVNGYVPAGGSVTSLLPARLLETRSGNTTVDGISNGIGRVAANSTTTLEVAGRGGISASADAVLVNVTAINPAARAFLTVFPCAADRPTAANLNAPAGGVVNNLVTAKVSAAGTICVFSSAPTDLVVDVAAFVPDDGGLLSIIPARLVETRNGPGDITIDGGAQGGGPVAADSVTQVQVDRGGVDRSATGVMLNVAAISPSTGGYMTVYPYPCDGVRPTAANVNFAAGAVVSNAVFVKVGQTGSAFAGNNNGFICVYSSAEAHLTVDVVAYTLDS